MGQRAAKRSIELPKYINEEQADILRNTYYNKTNYEIASLLNISRKSVTNWARAIGLELKGRSFSDTHRWFSINDKTFDAPNRENAYLLGWIISDGCLFGNKIIFTIQKRDRHILEYINNICNSTYPIKTHKKSTSYCPNINEYVTLELCSKTISNKLKSIGIIERKTGKEIFPTEYLEYKFDVLRGLIDGDGHIEYIQSKKYKYFRYGIHLSSASSKFLNNIVDIFSMGTVYYTGTCYRWSVHKKDDISTLYNNMYKDTEFFLKRKKDKVVNIINYINREIYR